MTTTPDSVDFERDVPTTQRDIEALERARNRVRSLSSKAYLDWLTLMSAGPRHSRETFEGWEPFEL